jgi:hypothetical protein
MPKKGSRSSPKKMVKKSSRKSPKKMVKKSSRKYHVKCDEEGTVSRSSYTTKRGVRVKSRCVRRSQRGPGKKMQCEGAGGVWKSGSKKRNRRGRCMAPKKAAAEERGEGETME